MNLPLLSHRFGRHFLPHDHRRRHRTRLLALSFAAALGALAPTVSLSAADLVVQGSNSPYAFTTGTASYDNIYVGQSANGTLNQSGGTLTAATGQLFLGYSRASPARTTSPGARSTRFPPTWPTAARASSPSRAAACITSPAPTARPTAAWTSATPAAAAARTTTTAAR